MVMMDGPFHFSPLSTCCILPPSLAVLHGYIMMTLDHVLVLCYYYYYYYDVLYDCMFTIFRQDFVSSLPLLSISMID